MNKDDFPVDMNYKGKHTHGQFAGWFAVNWFLPGIGFLVAALLSLANQALHTRLFGDELLPPILICVVPCLLAVIAGRLWNYFLYRVMKQELSLVPRGDDPPHPFHLDMKIAPTYYSSKVMGVVPRNASADQMVALISAFRSELRKYESPTTCLAHVYPYAKQDGGNALVPVLVAGEVPSLDTPYCTLALAQSSAGSIELCWLRFKLTGKDPTVWICYACILKSGGFAEGINTDNLPPRFQPLSNHVLGAWSEVVAAQTSLLRPAPSHVKESTSSTKTTRPRRAEE